MALSLEALCKMVQDQAKAQAAQAKTQAVILQALEQISKQKNQGPETPDTPTPALRRSPRKVQVDPKVQVAPAPALRRSPRKVQVTPTPAPRRSPRNKKHKVQVVQDDGEDVEDDGRPLKRVKREHAEDDEQPLKRTLSYDKASSKKKGTRQQKPLKDQILRKSLGYRLSALDEELLAGKFHNEGKFRDDLFFDKASPIIINLIGEEFSDEELPDKCMKMAKNIMVKRKRYQNTKDKAEGKGKRGKDKRGKGKRARKVGRVRKPKKNVGKRKLEFKVTPVKKKVTPVKKKGGKTRAKKKPSLIFPLQEENIDNVDADNVDELFESTDDADSKPAEAEAEAEAPAEAAGMSPDGVVSYDCLSCNRSMRSLKQCYPESERQDGLIFYCKKCYETKKSMDNMVVNIQNNAQQDRAEKRQTLPTKKSANKKSANKKSANKKSAVKKSANKKSAVKWEFDLWERVLCKLDGYRGYYRAEIYRRAKGKYSVYFLKEHTTALVSAGQLKKAKKGEDWTKYKRSEMINEHFFQPVDGRSTNIKFKIVGMGKGVRLHQVMCREEKRNGRLDMRDCSYFPVGHVLERLLARIS